MTTGERAGPVAVITDSVATVPDEMARALQIEVVPFRILLDGREYRDGRDLSAGELYRAMRSEGVLATTAQPPIADYQAAFRACLARGANAVVYIAVSSRLTGAVTTARLAVEALAEEGAQTPLTVLDSRSAASPQAFVVREAAHVAAAGGTLAEVHAAAEAARRRTGLIATLESLEYLARGGRIGRASALMGALLHVKPIISLDDEGQVVPIARRHGLRAALDELEAHVARHVAGSTRLRIAVLHTDHLTLADELAERAQAMMHPDELTTVELTPVMGAHTGPGVIGLAYYAES
jgi:DegV family protein with EDD domain